MAYSHGKNWTYTEIEKELKKVVYLAKLNTMPPHSLIHKITGDYSLSNAISRHGGTKYWSKRLNLPIRSCESRFGEEYELLCQEKLISMGIETEKMPIKYPYDLLADKKVKIDVKSSKLYKGQKGSFYTFNLEKIYQTCDIFVAFCINDENQVVAEYIIPASYLSGKSQLSIGTKKSLYDSFKSKWDIIEKYRDYMTDIDKTFSNY